MEEIKKITYKELKEAFFNFNKTHNYAKEAIKGVIVFREDNWPNDNYSLESRSYVVSSNCKAFVSSMSGYSIFGSSIDRSDRGVRLDQYIDIEYGGKDGWHIDYCYLIEE